MPLRFEWDGRKAQTNVRKHGVSFEKAATVLADPLSVTVPDPVQRDREDRFVTVGESLDGQLLVVVHSDRRDTIRLISARRATPRERKAYEEGTG